MSSSHRLSIRITLYLAFAIVATTASGIAWYGYHSSEQIMQEISEEATGSHQLLEHLGEIKYLATDTQRLALQSIQEHDIRPLLQIAIQANHFHTLINEMLPLLEKDDAAIAAALIQLTQEYRAHLFSVVEMSGDAIEGLETTVEKQHQMNIQWQLLSNSLEHISGKLKADAGKDLSALTEQTKQLLQIHVVSAVIIVTIILLLFILTQHQLIVPLREIKNFAEEISHQKSYESTRVPYHRNDEIGDLSNSINRMLDNLNRITVSRDHLAIAKQEAEHASNAKSEFLSCMSHELRTPLNAVLGFGQLLESDDEYPLTEYQLDQVHEIVKGGEHLLGLINDILDLAKVEAGHIVLSMEAIPYNEVIHECLSLVNPLAKQRQISIHHEPELLAGFCVRADRIRIKQVILNLLSNAVKYNKNHGTITLELALVTDNQVRLSITDTGAGITSEQIQELFRPFNRLGAEHSATEGTGIGLALSKRLVELQQGQIGVESTPGIGSSFWVDFPSCTLATSTVDDAPEISTSHPDSNHAPSKKILYIEDNPANLKMVEHLIRRRPNLTLISALNPVLGLELASAHYPDLILLDIQLPDMDGYQVLKRLQADEQTRNTPVIAISANAMPRDIKRGEAAGFVEYLTKPINAKQFMQVLDQTLKS